MTWTSQITRHADGRIELTATTVDDFAVRPIICDECGGVVPAGTECTPGTNTFHQRCCPECRKYPLPAPPCGSTEDR